MKFSLQEHLWFRCHLSPMDAGHMAPNGYENLKPWSLSPFFNLPTFTKLFSLWNSLVVWWTQQQLTKRLHNTDSWVLLLWHCCVMKCGGFSTLCYGDISSSCRDERKTWGHFRSKVNQDVSNILKMEQRQSLAAVLY